MTFKVTVEPKGDHHFECIITEGKAEIGRYVGTTRREALVGAWQDLANSVDDRE